MNGTKKRTRQSLTESEKIGSSDLIENGTSAVGSLSRNQSSWPRLINILKVTSKKPRPSGHAQGIGLASPPINEAIGLTLTPEDAIDALYSESAVAKIWGVAKKALDWVGNI